jgi:hypothetical protein
MRQWKCEEKIILWAGFEFAKYVIRKREYIYYVLRARLRVKGYIVWESMDFNKNVDVIISRLTNFIYKTVANITSSVSVRRSALSTYSSTERSQTFYFRLRTPEDCYFSCRRSSVISRSFCASIVKIRAVLSLSSTWINCRALFSIPSCVFFVVSFYKQTTICV